MARGHNASNSEIDYTWCDGCNGWGEVGDVRARGEGPGTETCYRCEGCGFGAVPDAWLDRNDRVKWN